MINILKTFFILFVLSFCSFVLIRATYIPYESKTLVSEVKDASFINIDDSILEKFSTGNSLLEIRTLQDNEKGRNTLFGIN